MENDLGDFVFFKVSSMRGVTQFGIKGELAPRYVGPFEIIERVGDVSYYLNCLLQLSHVHNVFPFPCSKEHTRPVICPTLCRDHTLGRRDI